MDAPLLCFLLGSCDQLVSSAPLRTHLLHLCGRQVCVTEVQGLPEHNCGWQRQEVGASHTQGHGWQGRPHGSRLLPTILPNQSGPRKHEELQAEPPTPHKMNEDERLCLHSGMSCDNRIGSQ